MTRRFPLEFVRFFFSVNDLSGFDDGTVSVACEQRIKIEVCGVMARWSDDSHFWVLVSGVDSCVPGSLREEF